MVRSEPRISARKRILERTQRMVRTRARNLAVAAASIFTCAVGAIGISAADLQSEGPAKPVAARARGQQSGGAVAAARDGTYTVTWNSALGSVFFRRFSADGTHLGPARRVSARQSLRRYDADVAVAPNGKTLVAWAEIGADPTATFTIAARRIGRGGRRVGPPFVVASVPSRIDPTPRVAAGSARNFLVAWRNDRMSVAGRLYDGKGRAKGDPMPLAEFYDGNGSSNSEHFDLASAHSGKFVIAWSDDLRADGYSGYNVRVWAREIDKNGGLGAVRGTNLDDEFYNERYNFLEGDDEVAVSADGEGNFVVANNAYNPGYYVLNSYPHYWSQYPYSLGIRTSRFAAGQTASVPTTQVGEREFDVVAGLDLASDRVGNYVVVWAGLEENPRRWRLRAQTVTCEDVRASPHSFFVTGRTEWEVYPHAAALDDGRYVITWTERVDGVGTDVLAKRFVMTDGCTASSTD